MLLKKEKNTYDRSQFWLSGST